jgi:hypothetical protein
MIAIYEIASFRQAGRLWLFPMNREIADRQITPHAT